MSRSKSSNHLARIDVPIANDYRSRNVSAETRTRREKRIVAELLQGFASDKDYRQARALLGDLPCVDLVGKDIALAAADNCRRLRKRGFTVRKTIDVLIGTFCIVHGHELLHADRDFDAME